MSATHIIDAAPLGALVRYSDGSPKPPARFTKKLAAWERSNGIGRLVKKEPQRIHGARNSPASFILHDGNFSSDGVILVTIMRSHSADSALTFDIVELPQPGQVKILLDFGGATELLHLAANKVAAELWIAREGYRNASLEVVGEDSETGNGNGGAGRNDCPRAPAGHVSPSSGQIPRGTLRRSPLSHQSDTDKKIAHGRDLSYLWLPD